MSELNPHIVKEHEGDYENTIQYFVTGRPLTDEEMLPDSHGVHPVSPLGFMLKEDGTAMVPTEPLSGFSAYNMFKDCPACGGTGRDGDNACDECHGTGHLKCSTCDGSGQVEDETTHNMVECPDCQGIGSVRFTAQEAYDASYKVTGKYYMFGSDVIAFPVLDIHRNNDGSAIVITVNGLLPPDDTTTIYFRNSTVDDYTPTGLVGEGVTFTPDSVTPDTESGTTELEVATDIVFDGVVVEGKLAMCIATDKQYLAIEDPDSDTTSGIYVMGETAGEPIRKVFNWYGIRDGESDQDERPPCYASNGYSDTEVERWVTEKVGGIVRHGCHPSAEQGDLRGAGGLVTWFTTCGDVDISGGAGQNSVIIPGFGLGYGYANGCAGEAKAIYKPDPDDSSERKWLIFGYGAKHDAVQADVGKTALPLDWPFSNSSDYADETRDNNITLIKDGALFDDGTERKIVGGLTRQSRECHVCNGSGEVSETSQCTNCNGTGEVMEDGRTRPCPACGGTGEVHTCPNCEGTGEEPDCTRCGGTGEVIDEMTQEVITCPDCNGNGFCGGHRYVMDKVHVCLYNDFKPSNATHEHVDGTTVLKKTFINLATPITQKDGDTFEVTVSLPNFGLDNAYSDDYLKNLSGYYAFVSQPRAYVVSGTWEFSDTRVYFTTKDLLEYDLGDTMFKDRNGDDLPDGTDVRVKIMFNAYQSKKFSAVGTLDNGKITLSGELDIPASLMRRIKRSADGEGNIHGSICGAAYVEPNNDTLSPAIKTNLGLNAVRYKDGEGNARGALGKDMGDGTPNSLRQYNKLYTADTGDDVREHVLFEADGTPKKDQRQIVATVYPTMTNTFPWALTHRRKLGFLDKLMTMEADGGIHSLFYRVYSMNRSILNSVTMESRLQDKDYPLDMYTDIDLEHGFESSESERLSVIGALVTIISNDGAVSTHPDAQPVRRALKAVKLLSDDYNNARVSCLGNVRTGYRIIDYVMGTKIREDGSEVSSFDSLGNLIDITTRNDYECMANAVRLRHLPHILTAAGTDPNTREPLSPELNAYPYENERYAYYSGNPYGYGDYDTTIRTDEVPCEVASASDTDMWPHRNSIVNACINNNLLTDPDMVDDLYRAAELCAIDLSDTLAISNIRKPQVYRDGDGSDISWMDSIDAFTKLISPDNIPVPKLETGFDYSDVFTVGTNDDQLPFIMTDAYGYYKLMNADVYNDADDDFIATTMPTDDSLARFLKEYVPSYAARLAVRNWDSFRVKVVDGTTSSGDTTYLTRMKWYDPACDAASRGIYASDAFLVGDTFSDVNLNRIEFATSDEALALNCSVPPYTVKPGYNSASPFASENYPYSVGYVRVFMKFMFSEDAGRWYCTDYRQSPVSYLSPLYGAKALDQRIDGKPLWVRPVCDSRSWKNHLYHTYEEYRPLDINPELANTVIAEKMLMVPYLPASEGGLGLNAPVNKFGTNTLDIIKGMPHANFWSVREYLRPATGAITFGDIPNYYKDGDKWTWGDAGGIMSDSTLWGQFDYPMKGDPEYHIPDTDMPDADLTKRALIYGKRNVSTGIMDTGDVQVGPHEDTIISVSYGTGRE